jgi:hypothetical protein
MGQFASCEALWLQRSGEGIAVALFVPLADLQNTILVFELQETDTKRRNVPIHLRKRKRRERGRP